MHRTGFFDVYDDAALMYVAGNRGPVHIGVWMANKNGGAKRAQQLVHRIAASFEG